MLNIPIKTAVSTATIKPMINLTEKYNPNQHTTAKTIEIIGCFPFTAKKRLSTPLATPAKNNITSIIINKKIAFPTIDLQYMQAVVN